MIEPFLALEASAGSGKTFALAIRYISLLFMGIKPSKILALTFTNKAANEMRSRIEGILKDLENKKSELKELSYILEVKQEELLEKRVKVYKNFIKDEKYIMTIDKFCTMILRKFSLYIALMPDFTVEQRDSQIIVLKKFIERLKESSLYDDFINFCALEEKKLNSLLDTLEFFYQKFYQLPPKKKYKKANIDHLSTLFNSLKDEIISCEKLSNKGKDALKIENIDDISKKGWICKDTLVQYSFFKKCFKSSWDEKFYKIKELLNNYISFKEARYINNLIDFFTIYKESKFRAKKELNDLSFSDIPAFTYHILSQGIDRDFFYFRLDSKFDHILIDEFQDTSILQYQILKPLIDEITSGYTKDVNRTLFYVGDVKQSIYRFRGGSKELFFEVAKKYGLNIERLNKNYRSAKEIVEFINDTFQGVIKEYFKQESFKKDGGYVEVITNDTLIENIKKIVLKLINSGIKPDDIAILSFTNEDSFLIASELKKNFSDIVISTGTNLLIKDDRSVKIIIELMKYIYFEDRYYLLNLLAMLGKELNENIEISNFNKDMNMFDFIKTAIDIFGLDSEILPQFIDIAGRFRDIESFLFRVDEFNDEIRGKEAKGLKVLTIHKSKGLEFKHLIVCDRLSRNIGDRSSFILLQENLSLKDIFLKEKNRECFDDRYKKAFENEANLSREDRLNTLYVAFTRAKESLFILQKEKNSAFSDLNLKSSQRGVFPKEHSLEKNHKRREVFNYLEPRVAKQNIEAALEEQNSFDSNFEAIDFGIATHYMLEIMDDFKEESIENAFMAMKNRYLDILGLDATMEIKNRVINLIKSKEFNDLIDGAKIYKELPLYYKGKTKQVDLLLEREQQIIIVDYKTSTKKEMAHFKQVNGYIEALNFITNKEIIGYLCYLKRDGVKIVKV